MNIKNIRIVVVVVGCLAALGAPMDIAFAKDSNSIIKVRQIAINQDGNCKKASFWRKTSSHTQIGNRTKLSSKGRDLPTGDLGRITISDGKHYIYTKWSNLKVKEYDFKIRLFDPDGELVSNSSSKLKNGYSGGEGWWYTWLNWTPEISKKTGDYRLVICEGGIKQVDQYISVVN